MLLLILQVHFLVSEIFCEKETLYNLSKRLIHSLTGKCNCTNGEMCIMGTDQKPKCMCPTECEEEEFDPHCSVFLSDYRNLCEVHRHACTMEVNVAVKHKGKCKGKQFHTQTEVDFLSEVQTRIGVSECHFSQTGWKSSSLLSHLT